MTINDKSIAKVQLTAANLEPQEISGEFCSRSTPRARKAPLPGCASARGPGAGGHRVGDKRLFLKKRFEAPQEWRAVPAGRINLPPVQPGRHAGSTVPVQPGGLHHHPSTAAAAFSASVLAQSAAETMRWVAACGLRLLHPSQARMVALQSNASGPVSHMRVFDRS